MNGLIFDPILPLPIIVILGAALLAWTFFTQWRVGEALTRLRRLVLLLFRIVGLLLVMALLLQPSRKESKPPPAKDRVILVGVDTSLSMKQTDAGQASRLDAAKQLLVENGAVAANGVPDNPRVRVFSFNTDAKPLLQSVLSLNPVGASTHLHNSVAAILNSASAADSVQGLILLSDGHDFQLVNPSKTGAAARARRVPIYAVAFGQQGKVRDVSTRITVYQPYCYVKQKARVACALRLVGCELETLTVQLLRQGQVVQTKRVGAEERQEVPVEFEVIEPEVGQFEYEVRVLPLEGEVDANNNSAITYLNVIDQQIRVLLVEGDPYWDTTFLQRSLMRNDKFDVDVIIRYGSDRVRSLRKTQRKGELKFPTSLEELSAYDVVILGRLVDHSMAAGGPALLNEYVKDRHGVIIFSRGSAFEQPGAAGELEPVLWSEESPGKVRLDPTTEGRRLAAFRVLQDQTPLPDLIDSRAAKATKPLAATLAVATTEGQEPAPAVVHRRYGRGQVVSVGVAGLWRWALNAAAQDQTSPFDRFWDQLVLWLLAGRDFVPSSQYSFRPSSANVSLGEKVHLTLTLRKPDARLKAVPVSVRYGDAEVSRLNLAALGQDRGKLSAEFVAERTGRYRAIATLPDGTTQEARFIVYSENVEETEVATDAVCLRRLCESSGGRLIKDDEFGKLLRELSTDTAEGSPQTQLHPVWNSAWVFYGVGLLFGVEWYLRRRWGLC